MILGTKFSQFLQLLHPTSLPPPPSLVVGAGSPKTGTHVPKMVCLLLPKGQGHSQQKRLCGMLPEDQPGIPVSSDLKPQIPIVEFFPFFSP